MMAKAKKSRKKDENNHPWVGKSILAGLSWLDPQGRVTQQRQIFGIITRINEAEHSMEVDKPDGEFWVLPYYPETTMQPPHGKYRCRSNGLEVKNPDLLMSWRVEQTEGGEGGGWQPNFLPFSEPIEPREWEFTPHYDFEYLRKDVAQRGHEFIGKHLLIGIRYYEVDAAERKFVGQEQLHGEIVRANPEDGIVIRQTNGEEFKMPPDLSMLEPAPKAEYKLRATGEVVVNPDYVATWAIDRPKKQEDG